jgi:uncharacterized protein YdhG (YjbR/CyaY superfamily)
VTVIDEHLKKLEPSKRMALIRIRALAKEKVQGEDEAIVYAMPTLKYRGKPFLGFAARKNHVGIYPFSSQVIRTLQERLHKFASSKGAIRVPYADPISGVLLRKIIDCRLKEIRAEIKS